MYPLESVADHIDYDEFFDSVVVTSKGVNNLICPENYRLITESEVHKMGIDKFCSSWLGQWGIETILSDDGKFVKILGSGYGCAIEPDSIKLDGSTFCAPDDPKFDTNSLKKYSSKNMNVTIDSCSSEGCAITVESDQRILFDKKSNVNIHITALNNNNVPIATNIGQIILNKSQLKNTRNGELTYGVAHGNVIFNQDDKSLSDISKAVISKVELNDAGRAYIDVLPESTNEFFKINAYWFDLDDSDSPILDELIALQVLSIPFINKIASSLDDPKLITSPIPDSHPINIKYSNYKRIIESDDTGIREGYLGFSLDFIELRTNKEINNFLFERLIKPSYKLGLIDQSLGTIEFADELRKEIILGLNQDTENEYGSYDHILHSIVMMFSGKIGNHISSDAIKENISINFISLLNDMNNPFLRKVVITKNNFDGKPKGKDIIGMSHYSYGNICSNGDPVLRYADGDTVIGPEHTISMSYIQDWCEVETNKGLAIYLRDTYSPHPYLLTGINNENNPNKGEFCSLNHNEYAPSHLAACWNISKIKVYELLIDLTFNSPHYDTKKESVVKFFRRANPDIYVDFDKGIISNSSRYGGYVGRSVLEVAADLFQSQRTSKNADYDKNKSLSIKNSQPPNSRESVDLLTPEQKAATKAALEAMGIDTVYPYGSLRQIQSSLLHRMAVKTDNPDLAKQLHNGGAPELYKAMLGKIPAKRSLFENMEKQILHSILSSSGLKVDDLDWVYNSLQRLDELNEYMAGFSRIVSFEDDGTPIETLPFSDEEFVRGQLNSCGIPKDRVDANWEKYLLQDSLNLVPTMYDTKAPEDVTACIKRKVLDFYAVLSYNHSIKDFWHHHYYILQGNLSEIAALTITLKAKLENKMSWHDSVKVDTLRLFTKYSEDKYKKGTFGSTLLEKRDVNDYWALGSTSMPFAMKTGGNLYDFMQVFNLQLVENFNININPNNYQPYANISPQYWQRCRQTGTYIFYRCSNLNYYTFYAEGTNEQIIRIVFKEVLKRFKNDLDSQYKPPMKFNDFFNKYIKPILQSFIPLWGTLESIAKGDQLGMGIGIIGDLMFFIPIDTMLDVVEGSVKSVRVALNTGVETTDSTMGVIKSGKSMLNSARPNRYKYRSKASDIVSNIPSNVEDILNKVHHINDLPISGNTTSLTVRKTSKKPDPTKPDSEDIGLDSIGSKYNGNTNELKDNGDGTYQTNDKKTVIKHGDNYYTVEYDEVTEQWYMVDEKGKRQEPVDKDENGNFKPSKNYFTKYDAINFGAQKISARSKIIKLAYGLLKIDNKYTAIEIDGMYFKAEYDSFYNSPYIYNECNDKIPLSGPFKKKWYKDVKASQYCSFSRNNSQISLPKIGNCDL